MRLTIRKIILHFIAAELVMLGVLLPGSVHAASYSALYKQEGPACSLEHDGSTACQTGFHYASIRPQPGPLLRCNDAGYGPKSKYRQACIDGANRAIAAVPLSDHQLSVCGQYLKGYFPGVNNSYSQNFMSCTNSTPKTAPKRTEPTKSPKPAPKKTTPKKTTPKKTTPQTAPASSVDPAIKCDKDNCDLINNYINPAINLFSLCFGLIAIISLIMGGIQYSASQGDPQKTALAKNRITNTILAIFAYLFLYAFLQFLIPGGAFR